MDTPVLVYRDFRNGRWSPHPLTLGAGLAGDRWVGPPPPLKGYLTGGLSDFVRGPRSPTLPHLQLKGEVGGPSPPLVVDRGVYDKISVIFISCIITYYLVLAANIATPQIQNQRNFS
jgi:hypothetical protein